jgi:hypothetical protein
MARKPRGRDGVGPGNAEHEGAGDDSGESEGEALARGCVATGGSMIFGCLFMGGGFLQNSTIY